MHGKGNFNEMCTFSKAFTFAKFPALVPTSSFLVNGEGLQPLFPTPWPSFPIQLLPAERIFNLKETLISE